MRLAVELYGTVVGHLVGDSWRTATFVATSEGVDRFGDGSRILSLGIPLTERTGRTKQPRARAFFEGLLPEGTARQFLAGRAGVRPNDVPALLARFGRDIAGALQIWDLDDPTEPRTPATRELSRPELVELLRDYPMSLGNLPGTGKTSLAGMQPKIALARIEGRWHAVEGGYPSTHILKPAATARTPIFNEHFGHAIAQAAGLSDFDMDLIDIDDIPVLTVARFDRDPGVPGGRIHQEDFAQALGVLGDAKYQELGGQVTLQRIADTLPGRADREELLRRVTLTYVLNDLDQHAKNIAVLHRLDGSTALTPAYDTVPFLPGETDGRFALAIGGEYASSAVSIRHVVEEGRRWRLSAPEIVVDETLERLAAAVAAIDPDPRTSPSVVELTASRIDRGLVELAGSSGSASPPRSGEGTFVRRPADR